MEIEQQPTRPYILDLLRECGETTKSQTLRHDIDTALAALVIPGDVTEHQCYAAEAAMQFGFEHLDGDAEYMYCTIPQLSALLDHVAKHAAKHAKASLQPIDTAPMDGTAFLGYRDGRFGEAYRIPRDDCEMWCFRGTSAAVSILPQVKPTHWMHLPPEPV